MENKKTDKPVIIELAEAKNELAETINRFLNVKKLPCFLIEPMLAEALQQVKQGAINELAIATKQYAEQTKEV